MTCVTTQSRVNPTIHHHCCIVRADLPPGVFAAQLLHAAGESFGFQRVLNCVCLRLHYWTYPDGETDAGHKPDPSCIVCNGKGYYKPAVYAVALHARSEAELLELERQLVEAKIEHQAIREPDAPWHGELMAIGIRPQLRDGYCQFTKKFKLVR